MFKNQLYIYLLYNIWCDSYLRNKKCLNSNKNISFFLNFLEATIIFVEWTFECKCALCVTVETCWLLKTTRFNNYTNRLSHTILFLLFSAEIKRKNKILWLFYTYERIGLFDGLRNCFITFEQFLCFLFLFDEANKKQKF